MAQALSRSSVRQAAAHVLAVTVQAWGIASASPHALARRAPHGYVPVRARRRLQASANAAASSPACIAHSW